MKFAVMVAGLTLLFLSPAMAEVPIHKDAPAASLAMTAFGAAWRCNPNGKYHEAEEAPGKAIRGLQTRRTP